MTTIAETDTLQRAPDLIAADMDGETVMLDVESGAYFGLRGVGGRVWDLLEHPQTLPQLTAAIASEFEVDPATCRADLQAFLAKLIDNDLVQRG
jgi:hypothetical protein